VVECLPSKGKAPSSNSSTAKRKEGRKGGREKGRDEGKDGEREGSSKFPKRQQKWLRVAPVVETGTRMGR
jgi:hypothetical protein